MKSRQAGVTMLEVVIAAVLLAGVFAMTFAILGSTSESAARAQITLELEDRARKVLNDMMADIKQSRTTGFRARGGNQSLQPLAASDSSTPISNGLFMVYPHNDIEFRQQGIDNAGFTPGTFASAPETYWNRLIRYRLVMDSGENIASGMPDGVDNNTNGVVDEMAIQKTETRINGVTGATLPSTANEPNPVVSIVCRDVQKNGLQIRYLATQTKGADTWTANRFEITLTLEKRDPRFKTAITKTVQTFVDIRN